MTWNCPFCGHNQVVTGGSFNLIRGFIGTERNRYDVRGYAIKMTECLNPECKEFAAEVMLVGVKQNTVGQTVIAIEDVKFRSRIRPVSAARPQHACIPPQLVRDYEEACAIVELSPKAAATLCRRCLQGMIRNFCGISRSTLAQEIAELKKAVDTGTAPRQVSDESVEAIDSVRSIGNIGAHFERDIDLIIEVDDGEALRLVSLIELLFEEWYVARFDRVRRLGEVRETGLAKTAERRLLSS